MTPENIQIVRYQPDDHRPLLHFLNGGALNEVYLADVCANGRLLRF